MPYQAVESWSHCDQWGFLWGKRIRGCAVDHPFSPSSYTGTGLRINHHKSFFLNGFSFLFSPRFASRFISDLEKDRTLYLTGTRNRVHHLSRSHSVCSTGAPTGGEEETGGKATEALIPSAKDYTNWKSEKRRKRKHPKLFPKGKKPCNDSFYGGTFSALSLSLLGNYGTSGPHARVH